MPLEPIDGLPATRDGAAGPARPRRRPALGHPLHRRGARRHGALREDRALPHRRQLGRPAVHDRPRVHRRPHQPLARLLRHRDLDPSNNAARRCLTGSSAPREPDRTGAMVGARGLRGVHGGGALRVCFVCLGNICRSPAAQAVFAELAAADGVDVTVDSAGTSRYHLGETPHEHTRGRSAAAGHRHRPPRPPVHGRRLRPLRRRRRHGRRQPARPPAPRPRRRGTGEGDDAAGRRRRRRGARPVGPAAERVRRDVRPPARRLRSTCWRARGDRPPARARRRPRRHGRDARQRRRHRPRLPPHHARRPAVPEDPSRPDARAVRAGGRRPAGVAGDGHDRRPRGAAGGAERPGAGVDRRRRPHGDERDRPRPPPRRPPPHDRPAVRRPRRRTRRLPRLAARRPHADRRLGDVLRRAPGAAADPAGRRARPHRSRCARPRRTGGWPAPPSCADRPSRPRCCTATCGPATASSTAAARTGSSTRPCTGATARSTWR